MPEDCSEEQCRPEGVLQSPEAESRDEPKEEQEEQAEEEQPKEEPNEEPEVVLGTEPSEHEESTGAWLERLLGPAKFPPGLGRSAEHRRSGKEQRERLEELAKPRQVKEPKEPEWQPEIPRPRSPRSQREACKRLAQPRKPKVEATPPEHHHEDRRERHEDPADLEEEEAQAEEARQAESPEPPVKIIPSLLAQCPARLERIDEEAKEQTRRKQGQGQGGQGGQGRRPRARSQGAVSQRGRCAPYAVPVVPKHLVEGREPRAKESKESKEPKEPKESKEVAEGKRPSAAAAGPSRWGGEEEDPEDLSAEEMARLTSLLAGDVSEESEAMLNNIDALYSQLMGARSHELHTDPESPEDASGSPAPGSFPEGTETEDTPDFGTVPSSQHRRSDGEDLLADIDRLYSKMLKDAKPPGQPSETFEPTESSPTSLTSREPRQPRVTQLLRAF